MNELLAVTELLLFTGEVFPVDADLCFNLNQSDNIDLYEVAICVILNKSGR